jgi:hypothetical protein
MDDTTETPPAGAASTMEGPQGPSEARPGSALWTALAGLQAAMVGVLWMLAWLGIDSSWDRRGFWYEVNLFSSLFYGNDAIRSSFGLKTMPGLALYLLVYSVLGCIFALALRKRVRPFRLLLAGLIFALGWFYLSFHVLWKSFMPLAYLLYADRPMVVGHLIFGACLARFPAYFPMPQVAQIAPPVDTAPPAEAQS